MAFTNQPFAEAAKEWDLETLYADLASVKRKPLTPTEKLHLRGLLCGHSPAEMAEKLNKDNRGVEADLSATVYRWVKELLDKCSDRLDNWRNISEWLGEAGYKCSTSAQIPLNGLLPDNSLVNISNIIIENNQVVFVINLRIPTSKGEDIMNNI